MNNLHLPSTSRSTATGWNFPLGIDGFRYADLNRVRRLMALYQAFRDDLRSADETLADRYDQACGDVTQPADTELLIEVGRHLDAFIGRLFHIEAEVNELNRHTTEDRTVFEFKKRFLDRLILKTPPAAAELAAMNIAELEFRYRECVAEILSRGEWATDPEHAELAEELRSSCCIDRRRPRQARMSPSCTDVKPFCTTSRPGREPWRFIQSSSSAAGNSRPSYIPRSSTSKIWWPANSIIRSSRPSSKARPTGSATATASA